MPRVRRNRLLELPAHRVAASLLRLFVLVFCGQLLITSFLEVGLEAATAAPGGRRQPPAKRPAKPPAASRLPTSSPKQSGRNSTLVRRQAPNDCIGPKTHDHLLLDYPPKPVGPSAGTTTPAPANYGHKKSVTFMLTMPVARGETEDVMNSPYEPFWANNVCAKLAAIQQKELDDKLDEIEQAGKPNQKGQLIETAKLIGGILWFRNKSLSANARRQFEGIEVTPPAHRPPILYPSNISRRPKKRENDSSGRRPKRESVEQVAAAAGDESDADSELSRRVEESLAKLVAERVAIQENLAAAKRKRKKSLRTTTQRPEEEEEEGHNLVDRQNREKEGALESGGEDRQDFLSFGPSLFGTTKPATTLFGGGDGDDSLNLGLSRLEQLAAAAGEESAELKEAALEAVAESAGGWPPAKFNFTDPDFDDYFKSKFKLKLRKPKKKQPKKKVPKGRKDSSEKGERRPPEGASRAEHVPTAAPQPPTSPLQRDKRKDPHETFKKFTEYTYAIAWDLWGALSQLKESREKAQELYDALGKKMEFVKRDLTPARLSEIKEFHRRMFPEFPRELTHADLTPHLGGIYCARTHELCRNLTSYFEFFSVAFEEVVAEKTAELTGVLGETDCPTVACKAAERELNSHKTFERYLYHILCETKDLFSHLNGIELMRRELGSATLLRERFPVAAHYQQYVNLRNQDAPRYKHYASVRVRSPLEAWRSLNSAQLVREKQAPKYAWRSVMPPELRLMMRNNWERYYRNYLILGDYLEVARFYQELLQYSVPDPWPKER